MLQFHKFRATTHRIIDKQNKKKNLGWQWIKHMTSGRAS